MLVNIVIYAVKSHNFNVVNVLMLDIANNNIKRLIGQHIVQNV